METEVDVEGPSNWLVAMVWIWAILLLPLWIILGAPVIIRDFLKGGPPAPGHRLP